MLVLAPLIVIFTLLMRLLLTPPNRWWGLSDRNPEDIDVTSSTLLDALTTGGIQPHSKMEELTAKGLKWIMGDVARLVDKTLAVTVPPGITPARGHDVARDPRKEVTLRMIVSRVKDINAKAHAFHAQVMVEATWSDDNTLAWWQSMGYQDTAQIQEALNDKGTNLIAQIWTPELYFENLVNVDLGTLRSDRLGQAAIMERWFKVYTSKEGAHFRPLISCRMRAIGTFATKFNLKYFPIDRQVLSIVIRSHHPAHTIHLCQPRDADKYYSICRLDTFVHDDEWNMGMRLLAYESRSRATDNLNVPPKIFAEYQFKIKVARKWAGYVWDLLLPISLLSLFAITSLVVPRDSLGERIAITLAMVLASLAFRYTFIERVPVVSYLTAMDKIIVFNFLLLGALVAPAGLEPTESLVPRQDRFRCIHQSRFLNPTSG